MKGFEDAVYIVAIFFTFVLGISAMYVFYIRSQEMSLEKSMAEMESEKIQIIKDYFGVSDELVEKIISGRLRVSLEFVGFINGTNAIIVRNSGDAPLSDFLVVLDGEEVVPVIAPDILLPESYGIILFDDAAWERFSVSRIAEIKTRHDSKLIVRK